MGSSSRDELTFEEAPSPASTVGSKNVLRRSVITVMALLLVVPVAIDLVELYRAILMSRTEGILSAVVSLASVIALPVGMLWVLDAQIFRPLAVVRRVLRDIGLGKDVIDLPEEGDSDMAAINQKCNQISARLRELILICEDVACGDFRDQAEVMGKDDRLAHAVNRMIGNLQDVVSQASVISAGDYSSEVRPHSDRDELGLALYAMTKSLRDVVAVCEGVVSGDYSGRVEVKGQHDRLALVTNEMIASLSEITGNLEKTGSRIEEVSLRQLESVRNQSVAVEEIATTVTELSASAQKVAETASAVRNHAEQGAQDCELGGENITEAVSAMEGIRQRIHKLTEHMTGLGSRSQQIGGVLDIMGELSEQTNLLSLNASIEAAGAGEAGKRFAVVASEIRKLAERADDAAEEIRDLISGIQETVNTAIMATEEGEKAVHEGVRLAGEVDLSFQGIASQVSSTAQASTAIEMGSRQQATAIEQIGDAVRGIDKGAQNSETIARELTSEAESLALMVRRLRGGLREEKEAANS